MLKLEKIVLKLNVQFKTALSLSKTIKTVENIIFPIKFSTIFILQFQIIVFLYSKMAMFMELDHQTRKNEKVPNPIDELSNVELIQRYRFDRNSIEYSMS